MKDLLLPCGCRLIEDQFPRLGGDELEALMFPRFMRADSCFLPHDMTAGPLVTISIPDGSLK